LSHYTIEELKKIYKYPHLLGNLAGKEKWNKLHSDWIHYCWDKTHHCSLQAHRGSMKTSTITEFGSIMDLSRYPDHRIAIVKKTYTSASESVRNIANLMMTPDVHDFLEDMWGKWKFDTLKEGKIKISAKKTNTKEVSIEALGIDSSFTGRHYDRIVFDDIIDLDDRLSQAEREHTKIAVGEFMANIIDPGGHVLAVGTPWQTWNEA